MSHVLREQMRRVFVMGLVSFLIVFARGEISGAENVEPYVLDLAAPQTGEIKFNVTAQGGAQTLTIFRIAGEAKSQKVKFHISPFTSDQGEPLGAPVGIRLPDQPKPQIPQTTLTSVPFDQSSLDIILDVPGPPTTTNYSGRLSLFGPEKPKGLHWKVIITRAPLRAPQADLLVSPNTLPAIPITVSPFSSSTEEKASFTVTLQEKSRLSAANGITAVLEKIDRAPEGGLDLSRNFVFRAKNEFFDLTRSPADRAKGLTIKEGEQVGVQIGLKGLSVGEYTATLRFRAPEAAEKDTQKVTFTVKVRHHWAYPLTILILAVVLAFFTVKGLGTRKQRLEFLKKIEQQRANLPQPGDLTLPYVRARALLRQADALSERLWLTALDEINNRLGAAEFLINFIRDLDYLRKRLAQTPTPPPVTGRLEGLIHEITARIGASLPTEQAKAQLAQAIAEINNWFNPGELEKKYWIDLSGRIGVLAADVNPNAVKGDAGKAVIQTLLADVKGTLASPPADFNGKVQAGRTYRTLKLLWDRRTSPDFDHLISCHNDNQPLEFLFDDVNDKTWEQITTKTDDLLSVTVPQAQGPERLEAYDLLTFRFGTGDPNLDESYLIQRGLRYEWTITLTPKTGKSERIARWIRESALPNTLTLRPVTTSPSVVQFFPLEGEVQAQVRVSRGQQSIAARMHAPLTIRRSKVFAWVKGFDTVETVTAIMTLVVAVAFGLTTQVLNKETFGSVVDYLNLFVWGAGAEGAKRLLQSMRDYSS